MSKKPSPSLAAELKPFVAPFRFDGASAREVRAAPRIDEHGVGIREQLRNAPGEWPSR